MSLLTVTRESSLGRCEPRPDHQRECGPRWWLRSRPPLRAGGAGRGPGAGLGRGAAAGASALTAGQQHNSRTWAQRERVLFSFLLFYHQEKHQILALYGLQIQ